MKSEKDLLLCAGALILIYFLFSGSVIEGAGRYVKKPKGTLCDKKFRIITRAECAQALKTLNLKQKYWKRGSFKDKPPGCSWKGKSNAFFNTSINKGAARADLYPICKGPANRISSAESDRLVSKKSRIYLKGISQSLTELTKLKYRKRRTPVNVHIDLGKAPVQSKLSSSQLTNAAIRATRGGGGSGIGAGGRNKFAPTLGFSQARGGGGEGPDGAGPDSQGLKGQSKASDDLRNYGSYSESVRHPHKKGKENKFKGKEKPQPIKPSKQQMDAATVRSKPVKTEIGDYYCKTDDHRGCRQLHLEEMKKAKAKAKQEFEKAKRVAARENRKQKMKEDRLERLRIKRIKERQDESRKRSKKEAKMVAKHTKNENKRRAAHEKALEARSKREEKRIQARQKRALERAKKMAKEKERKKKQKEKERKEKARKEKEERMKRLKRRQQMMRRRKRKRKRKKSRNKLGKYGIKQIIYDKKRKLSPHLQKQLGKGVHNYNKSTQDVSGDLRDDTPWYRPKDSSYLWGPWRTPESKGPQPNYWY